MREAGGCHQEVRANDDDCLHVGVGWMDVGQTYLLTVEIASVQLWKRTTVEFMQIARIKECKRSPPSLPEIFS